MRFYRAHGLAGCVERRRTRQGPLVGVYRCDQAGLDDENPWATVCEAHGTILSHDTLHLARYHASAPLDWCEHCREEDGR